MSKQILKLSTGAAGVGAVVALAVALVGSGSTPTTQAAVAGAVPVSATTPQGAPPYGAPGGRPGRGFGAPVTGEAADKVKAAALARYPGTVEQIMALPDGSYVAHVIAKDGTEKHVLVSKDFAVTGVAPDRGPGDGRHGRPGGPGFGAPVTGDVADKVKAAALAKYPGTVERVAKLPDGSFVAHVIAKDGTEKHVLVDKDYNVTGVGPDRGPRSPHDGAPPAPPVPPGATTS